ncbi:MAG: Crp/Fnr family transcriptional regulator [Chitinophagaceae bacterium]|nr:MAG: Crp/Fnr family transcriptional regulator [Chitinophagaceae bacterium]
MYEQLRQKFDESISLTDEEFEICKTLFQPKKLRKKQYLLQEGDVCKYTAFVEKGILRSYTIDQKGAEHILQFAMEGWWLGDLYSFFTGLPSNYTMDALEESELLLISKPNWDILLERVPKLERFFRIIIQNNLISTQRRLIGSFSETAEKKYEKLIHSFSDCFQRVPQHMIASYLGITRETLSRIRNNISKKKS